MLGTWRFSPCKRLLGPELGGTEWCVQVAARSVTKGQRQQLRDVLDGSEVGAGGSSTARSAGQRGLQELQPGVLMSERGSAGVTQGQPESTSDAQPGEQRHRGDARGSQAARSPLGEGPIRGTASTHNRANSKISSVMSAMPWHRNKEGENTSGGTEP